MRRRFREKRILWRGNYQYRCSQCGEELWTERSHAHSKFREHCPGCGSLALDLVYSRLEEVRKEKFEQTPEDVSPGSVSPILEAPRYPRSNTS